MAIFYCPSLDNNVRSNAVNMREQNQNWRRIKFWSVLKKKLAPSIPGFFRRNSLVVMVWWKMATILEIRTTFNCLLCRRRFANILDRRYIYYLYIYLYELTMVCSLLTGWNLCVDLNESLETVVGSTLALLGGLSPQVLQKCSTSAQVPHKCTSAPQVQKCSTLALLGRLSPQVLRPVG